MRLRSLSIIWISLVLLACPAAYAADLTGAGASFPYPIYAKWAAQYHKETGHRVNYQSIGSGGGQQQIIAGTVDFGASDDPMPLDQLQRYDLLQFPAIIGAIVPIVNLPGVAAGELRLTGPVLADIFLGRITRWDDPAIAALNPGLKLPAHGIVVVHRADGSGTTFVWTHYLSQVSARWAAEVGQGKAIKWPTGHGGKGNEGVAAYVRQIRNAIGYVEFAYAHQNDLSWAQLENRAGRFVQPTQDTFVAAALAASDDDDPSMGLMLDNQAGPDAWPITAASFILVRKRPIRPERNQQVYAFFDWAFSQGAALARTLDYVPLPDPLVQRIRALWSAP
ncbi:phosphate ABC transporter substrate-binding protein PstS [Castellaniella sp.]|uniref:phosphate ABC transporter substrate-binding protein PstS n=1 Tax=Castellaniella sp. TaxID=1955812 RepID=UPI003566B4E5